MSTAARQFRRCLCLSDGMKLIGDREFLNRAKDAGEVRYGDLSMGQLERIALDYIERAWRYRREDVRITRRYDAAD